MEKIDKRVLKEGANPDFTPEEVAQILKERTLQRTGMTEEQYEAQRRAFE